MAAETWCCVWLICGDEDWRCCDCGLWAAAVTVSTGEGRRVARRLTGLGCGLVSTSKLEQARDGGQRGLLLLCGGRGRGLGPLSLVVVVVVLCRGGVEGSLVGPGLGLLVVGGVGLLEGVAVADAAVDHAGKVHCHRREGGGGNGGGGGGVVER
jgi:hypothetical protein